MWSLDGTRNVVMENEVELLHMPTSDKLNGSVTNGSKASAADEAEEVGRDINWVFSSVSCENRLQMTLALAESCGIGLANRMLDAGAGKILEEAKIENAQQ